MAKDPQGYFVSGKLHALVSFNDRTDQYKVKLCPSFGVKEPHERAKSERCEIVHVGLPGSGARSSHGRRLAVDDPRSMRNAVHAAISFASRDIQNYADLNRQGSGWLVRPPKRNKRKG